MFATDGLLTLLPNVNVLCRDAHREYKFPQLTLFPSGYPNWTTPSWEQRKLGEIIQLGGSGGTPSATNPNYYGGEIPFLSIADIEGRDIVHTAKTLTKEGLRNSAAWIVPAGAVSLAMYASVGKVGIIRQDTATSQAFYNMVFEDVAIRDFVFTRLEKADASFEWEPYISTGTQRNLNADKVKAFAIAVPGSREAAKIGRYFANLDSLITLHQRKCQCRSLCGYLSWEQRKLGELCTISKGHGYSKADIMDVGTPLILYGRLYTQYESRIEEVDTFAVEQEGSLLSKGNEVIVPASGETAEDIAVASSVRRSGIIFGSDLNVVTPVSKLDPDYTALSITYSKAHDDLAKRAQGKSVVHVHGNDIAEVEISYPSESEQKRISTVVLGLDSLITLHQ